MLSLSVGSGGVLGMRQSDTSPLAFAGEYVPIAVLYVDSHVYIHMIKQNGTSKFIRPVHLTKSVFPEGRMLLHEDFFEPSTVNSSSEPRLQANMIPPGSPVVSLLFRPFPNDKVEIRFARVVSEKQLSDRSERIVSSADWSAHRLPTVELDGTTLTITQKTSRDWRQVGPLLPPKPPLPPKPLPPPPIRRR
jgi:hypothetical protein